MAREKYDFFDSKSILTSLIALYNIYSDTLETNKRHLQSLKCPRARAQSKKISLNTYSLSLA